MTEFTGIELSYAHVFEIEKGITYTRFKTYQEVNLAEAKKLNEARRVINGEESFYSLVNLSGVYGSVSKEGQTYWAQECECASQIKFEAIIISSLPVRIIAKNYIKQFNPKFETKLFRSEKQALEAIHQRMKNEI